MEDNNTSLGIYFENHEYSGVQSPIISFDIDDHIIRYTIINGKPYFMMTDICRLLSLDTNNAYHIVKSAVEILSIFKDNFEDKNFIDKLYFYLYIDITHLSKSGPVTRKNIRSIFISEHLLNMIIARSRKLVNYQYKTNLIRRIYDFVNNN